MPSTSDVIFGPVAECDVTRAIAREYATQFDDYVESDVLIAGGGPSGLICAKTLAERGRKVLVLEGNNFLGGGFWIGGYLMNKAVFRAPSHEILDDLGVPYVEASDGLYVADAPHACAKLIGAACDAGAKIQNMTFAEDIVVREGNRVAGLVINWTPVKSLPRQLACVDPVALEAKVVAALLCMYASEGRCTSACLRWCTNCTRRGAWNRRVSSRRPWTRPRVFFLNEQTWKRSQSTASSKPVGTWTTPPSGARSGSRTRSVSFTIWG